jgi:hypothetical protein
MSSLGELRVHTAADHDMLLTPVQLPSGRQQSSVKPRRCRPYLIRILALFLALFAR